jgi:uncharacterized pyridoxamine 5'-phosphate oxidase family protein
MTQRFAVLATQQGDQPYINLIAFATSDNHSFILFATSRNTQKYRNIQENEKVAILIKDHVAFYPGRVNACYVDGERVQAQEGDFYGGWITSEIEGPFKGGPGTSGW